MRTLAFDGRTGASGDMLLAALVAAGADPAVLSPIEDALDVEFHVSTTTRNGLAATTVDVAVGADHEDADHSHSHEDGTGHAEGAGPVRGYAEVVDLIDGMDLDEAVAQRAQAVVRRLAEAEAAVHGSTIDEIHFHEVGADDAIADIVGVCLLLDALDVDRVVTTPVAAGGGAVEMSHGTYPVPAPAVVELAAGATWRLDGGPLETELLTPTGAALLAELAEGVDALPPLSVSASGYGAGTKSFDDYPNVLRVVVGDGAGGLKHDDITVLETNLDDATPEVLGGLQESLVDAGARDVSIVPATMKKARPGHLVKVITKPEDAARVAHRLAVETGTLGIREHGAGHRWVAERDFETVTLSVGGATYDVPVKVASTVDGDVYDVSAEYDDAAAVARETALPVREVVRKAETAARERLEAADDPTRDE